MEGGKDEVSGKGCLVGNGCRLGVPYLPDEDNIWILPEYGAECEGEAQPRLLIDRHLVYPLEFILYRVLDGDDVYLLLHYVLYHGIEGGALSTACGAGDEDNPLRPLGNILDILYHLVILFIGTYLLQFKERRFRVQEPHNHCLSVLCREGGDPDVELLVAEPHLDSPVLGYPPLGDIHLRHDLYSRYDGTDDPLRQLHCRFHQPVDPEAQLNGLVVGLNMNIACPVVQGVDDNGVDHFDDGRGGAFSEELGDILCGFRLMNHLDQFVLMKINHQLFNGFIDVVVPVDRGGNLQMGGGTRFYLHPGGKPQVINGIEVQRISHCDLQYLLINLKGDSEVLLGKVLIDALYCLGVYGGGREIYKLYFELKGKGLGDIDVGGKLLLYQDGADPDVFLLPGLLEGQLELFFGYEARLNKEFSQLFYSHLTTCDVLLLNAGKRFQYGSD